MIKLFSTTLLNLQSLYWTKGRRNGFETYPGHVRDGFAWLSVIHRAGIGISSGAPDARP